MLTDLYSRKDSLAKLTGAAGLVDQGILPEEIDEDSFLVQTVRNSTNSIEKELAIIVLGKTKNNKALPCLLEALKKRPNSYENRYCIYEAVACIRSPDAIPVLRDCLNSDQFYAIPEAFRALICLGDREAIPLAITRVTMTVESHPENRILKQLEKVTGQSFGDDWAEWEQWWESVKNDWQIPSKFAKPWDEQAKMY